MRWAGLMVLTIAGIAWSEPHDVWLDVDPAIGMIERDVDDGLAMIQAFHSPELRIHGVSINFGNSPLERGHEIGREVVERFGPPGLEVYPGAAAATDLGKETDAVQAMVGALRARPMTILALGPVTNVATLVSRYPDLHENITAIVMVAARRPGQVFRPKPESENHFPDFNFESDPKAMEVILGTGIPLVFAPWEVSSHVWMEQTDLDRLSATGPTGAYIAKKSRSWIGMWKRMFSTEGFNPFDTLAVAWVTHPEVLKRVEVSTRIDWRVGAESEDGEAPVPHLLVDTDATEGRRAIYCYEPTAAFKPLLLERLVGAGK